MKFNIVNYKVMIILFTNTFVIHLDVQNKISNQLNTNIQ